MCRACKNDLDRFSHSNLTDATELVRWHVLEYGRQPTLRWMRRRINRAILAVVQDEINRHDLVNGSPVISYSVKSPRLFDHRRGIRWGRLLTFPRTMPSLPRFSAGIKGATWASLLGGLCLATRDAVMADLLEAGLVERVPK